MSTAIEFVLNLDIDPKSTDGYVNAGTILCFSNNVTSQHKSDVLNSILLAQLAANKQYNQFKEQDLWYKCYISILSKVGWIIETFHFEKYQAKDRSVEMTSAVISTADTALTKDQMAVIQKSLDALQKPDNEKQWKVFNRNSSSDSHSASASGNFRVIFCSESSSGQVTAFMSSFYFTASMTQKKWLWHKYKATDMSLFAGKQESTLNEEMYSSLRQTIVDKLGDKTGIFIAAINF